LQLGVEGHKILHQIAARWILFEFDSSCFVSGVCISLPYIGCVWWNTWGWLSQFAICVAHSADCVYVCRESTCRHFCARTERHQHCVHASCWLAALCKFIILLSLVYLTLL